MSKQEICYVKQAVRFTNDWDVYQRILRKVFKEMVVRSNTNSLLKSFLFLATATLCFVFVQDAAAMSRTTKSDPAVVLAAFGTTTKARVTYDFFEDQLKKELPEKYKKTVIRWAFTSEIVRERANKKFKEAGLDKRYRSLAQVLADLDDEGYRDVIIQPLHIFPGQEYEEVKKVAEAFEHMGLHTKIGGTLLHEWPFVFEAVSQVGKEFLASEEGCNVLVVHGTPETFPGSNSTYLGLDRYLGSTYSNVYIGGVDGVLTRTQAIVKAKQCIPKRVRLIPFMYVAGDHIMNDIMGEKVVDNEVSWAMELEAEGVAVDSVQNQFMGESLFKGLGFYPSINKMFIRQIVNSLDDLAI